MALVFVFVIAPLFVYFSDQEFVQDIFLGPVLFLLLIAIGWFGGLVWGWGIVSRSKSRINAESLFLEKVISYARIFLGIAIMLCGAWWIFWVLLLSGHLEFLGLRGCIGC